jgi:hypothetical protein
LGVVVGIIVFPALYSSSNGGIHNSVSVNSNVPVYGTSGGSAGGSGPEENVNGEKVTFENMSLEPLISLSWGNVTPGIPVSQTIFIDNTANADPQSLNFTLDNFVPVNASDFVSMSMNTTELPGSMISPVDVTLKVVGNPIASNITEVSFDLNINVGE